MTLTVTREKFTKRSVMGRMSGDFSAFTLEPSIDRPAHPAIPAGTYDLGISYSHRFKRQMIRVKDVPGRSGILIHSFNRPEQSEGCIGVGETQSEDFIGASRAACAALFKKVEAALLAGESVKLTVAGERRQGQTVTNSELWGEA